MIEYEDEDPEIRREFVERCKRNGVDCHMPLVPSNDKGNHSGKVHSHRFPGANTALPFVNGDRGGQTGRSPSYDHDVVVLVLVHALTIAPHLTV